MRYFFILNPGSKSGKSRKRFETIIDLFDEARIDYCYEVTKSLEDATKLSIYANNEGYDVIVAVGGDGTINRVLNGFFDGDGNRISKAKMGVVYTGTSPDFCKSYGIPVDMEEAVKLVLEDKSSKIRIGRIVLSNSYSKQYDNKIVDGSGDFCTRYFACCVNIGLGAALARRANSGIRGIVGDYAGTFFALIRTLFTYRPVEFTLVSDGNRQRESRVYNISIGRTFYIASGIKVANSLTHNDNGFYNMTVKNMNIGNWLKTINRVYSGKKICNDETLSLEYGNVIEVLGNNECPEIEFDGDPGGFLPCRIDMAAHCLDLICESEKGSFK